jgi:hypothetical protein
MGSYGPQLEGGHSKVFEVIMQSLKAVIGWLCIMWAVLWAASFDLRQQNAGSWPGNFLR